MKDALRNYRGKVLLLDAWATWCIPCVDALPKLAEFKREMAGRPFEAFLLKKQPPWVQWRGNSDRGVMRQLGVQYFPTLLIVDAKGVLRARIRELDERSRALIRTLVQDAGIDLQ